MKRIINIFLPIILIICGIGYFIYGNRASILGKMISHQTGFPITMKKIFFHKKSFVIQGLEIANPQKMECPVALKVQTIQIDAPYHRYLDNPIMIDRIHMSNIYVTIDTHHNNQPISNWDILINNTKKKDSSFPATKHKAIIKKLILTNIEIDLILPIGSIHHLSPIDHLEFDNIDSATGIPIQEITKIVIYKMINSIFIEKGLKTVIETPIDIIKKILPYPKQFNN